VLDHGETIFVGSPRDASQDTRVAEIYLGRKAS
jgi:ABC-type branched-subunit amino acid transport system ATPase component